MSLSALHPVQVFLYRTFIFLESYLRPLLENPTSIEVKSRGGPGPIVHISKQARAVNSPTSNLQPPTSNGPRLDPQHHLCDHLIVKSTTPIPLGFWRIGSDPGLATQPHSPVHYYNWCPQPSLIIHIFYTKSSSLIILPLTTSENV